MQNTFYSLSVNEQLVRHNVKPESSNIFHSKIKIKKTPKCYHPVNKWIQLPNKTKEYMSNIAKLLLKEKSRNSLRILINLKKVRNLLSNTFWNHSLAHNWYVELSVFKNTLNLIKNNSDLFMKSIFCCSFGFNIELRYAFEIWTKLDLYKLLYVV